MTTGPRSQCDACRHLRDGDIDQPWNCDAFPVAIPEPVLWNEQDHREPIPGDNGIQFEAKAGDTYPVYALPPATT